MRLGIKPVNGLESEINSGGDHQPVVGDRGALCRHDHLFDGVDLGYLVVDHLNAPALESVVGSSDLVHFANATNDKVGDWAGIKFFLTLNQGDFNGTLTPHIEIFCCCGTTETSAHNHNTPKFLAARTCHTPRGGTARQAHS